MKNLLRWIRGSERPAVPHERAESFSAPERETWLEQIGAPSLAVVGLLSHLLIFWLLSFPYKYVEYGMCEVDCISITTGWQTMGTILVLPVLPYLACLLPLLRKSVLIEASLEISLSLNVAVNLLGFLGIWWGSQPWGYDVDLYNRAWRDAASGIHVTLLLLAVVCSSAISLVLLAFLRRSRKLW